MLFKLEQLNGIKTGKIAYAYWKWLKLSVNTGSIINTAVGQIKIGEINIVSEEDINDQDAVESGYTNKQDLLKSFFRKSIGSIYKIAVSYHSEDPRIELRNEIELTDSEFEDLKNKLARFDKFSNHGPWTKTVLLAIQNNPNLHAIGIAKLNGFEKDWLKINIRKIKNLGLTIIHLVGYELSTRGMEFVNKYFNKE